MAEGSEGTLLCCLTSTYCCHYLCCLKILYDNGVRHCILCNIISFKYSMLHGGVGIPLMKQLLHARNLNIYINARIYIICTYMIITVSRSEINSPGCFFSIGRSRLQPNVSNNFETCIFPVHSIVQ